MISSILCYLPPSVELLGPKTPSFQIRLTPLITGNCSHVAYFDKSKVAQQTYTKSLLYFQCQHNAF